MAIPPDPSPGDSWPSRLFRRPGFRSRAAEDPVATALENAGVLVHDPDGRGRYFRQKQPLTDIFVVLSAPTSPLRPVAG